jgi:hypothetical protein
MILLDHPPCCYFLFCFSNAVRYGIGSSTLPCTSPLAVSLSAFTVSVCLALSVCPQYLNTNINFRADYGVDLEDDGCKKNNSNGIGSKIRTSVATTTFSFVIWPLLCFDNERQNFAIYATEEQDQCLTIDCVNSGDSYFR